MEVQELFNLVKKGGIKYDENYHCLLLLNIFADPKKGRISSYCVAAKISEIMFWHWIRDHQIFQDSYAMGKMIARENWELEGIEIGNEILPPGVNSNRMETWKMRGWSNFGIGKVNKIRLKLDPDATPNQHYHQLIKQACEGDFTAGEIKQLMEAINVGLNAHQVIKLQEEINQLKKDLELMQENSNGNHSGAIKGTTQDNQSTVEDCVRRSEN